MQVPVGATSTMGCAVGEAASELASGSVLFIKLFIYAPPTPQEKDTDRVLCVLFPHSPRYSAFADHHGVFNSEVALLNDQGFFRCGSYCG